MTDSTAATNASASATDTAPPMQGKRMLVLAPQPFFTPRGTPFSVYYRSLITAELGFTIDLLTYGQGEDVDIPGVRVFRGPALALFGEVKTGPSIAKIFHDICMFFSYLYLIIKNKYEVVHAHEEAVFFAAFCKPIFDYKLVYDMHSSLPEQLDNFGYSRNRLLKRIFEFLERRSLQRADAIITICPALQDQVQKLAPWAMAKHQLIENSIFDDVRLKRPPSDTQPIQASDYSGERASVVYAGTLEAYQGIDLLLEAVAEMTTKRTDFHLIIAGGRPDQVTDFEAQAKSLNVTQHCTFLGQLAPKQARDLASSASIILSPRSNGTNTPLKTYEQLACGVPLVATSIYSHTQVLDSELAVLVPPTAAGLAEGITRLLNDPAMGAALVERAKVHYETHYARPAYLRKLQTLLELVV